MDFKDVVVSRRSMRAYDDSKTVTKDQIDHIHKLLRLENKDSIVKDLALMPVWIRNIVMKAYEQE